MAFSDKLIEEGWYLSEEGIKNLSEDGKLTNHKAIIKKALDVDLRDIAAPGFVDDMIKGKPESIPGGYVVQLQKLRNLSAPKANEESQAAPRMLKLTLTDGHSVCHAVEVRKIPQLNLNVPPGTKLFLRPDNPIPVASGLLLLTPQNVEVLGGRVAALAERWELNRSLAKHTRRGASDEGGPPPWIPFGAKIVRSNPSDRNFKSLENKDKETKDNSEFETQRKDAIAEAGRAGAKKVFGGGNRQLLDHSVQQIVDLGFTIEQAEAALKSSRNNVDRALRSLQKRGGVQENGKGGASNATATAISASAGDAPSNGAPPREKAGRGRGRGGDKEKDEEGPPTGSAPKPSGRLSLRDFLEDKLLLPPDKEPEKEKPRNPTKNVTQNHVTEKRGGRTDRERNSDKVRGGGGGSGGGARTNSSRGGRTNVGIDKPKERREGKREEKGRGRGGGGASMRGASNAGMSGTAEWQDNKVFQQSAKPPRFQNQQPHRLQQLQHESSRYLGHTPSSAVVNNASTIGPGSGSGSGSGHGHGPGTDWSSALADNVAMMSLLDCEYTPDNHHGLLSSSTWSNSGQAGLSETDFRFRHVPPQQPQPPQPPQPQLSSRLSNINNRGQRLQNQQMMRQNPEPVGYSNHCYDSALLDRSGGRPQNKSYPDNLNYQLGNVRDAFSSLPPPPQPPPAAPSQNSIFGMPEIPEFPFKENNTGPPFAGRGGSPDNKLWQKEPPPRNGADPTWQWHRGDKCLAKYWEDNMYYNAEVTGVSERTCVVHFTDYGNHEEVLQGDCIPITENVMGHHLKNNVESHLPHFSGILEFRRAGARPYMNQRAPDNVGPPAPGVPSPNAVISPGSVPRERRPPRAHQSMYIPPAQRK